VSDTVLLQIIVSVQVVTVALIGAGVPWLMSTRKHARNAATDAAAAKEEVKNGHDTNLREEADDRHHETSDKFSLVLHRLTLVATRVEQVAEEVGGVRRSVGRLWVRSDKHADKINDIERTQDRIEIPQLPGSRGAHRKESP
jgi:uncharacterized protein YoxC